MKSATRWTREAVLSIGDIFASDNENEGTEGQDDNGGSGGTGQTDNGTGENPSGTGEDDGDDSDVDWKKKFQNKSEEQDRQFRKLREAERERDELKAKQEELDRKGKTELENAKADLDSLTKQNAALSDTVQRLTIENAFASLKGIEWHDVDAALRFVDLSEVEFDPESGKVKDKKALIKAAQDLAKEKPFLVKASAEDDKNGTGNGTNPRATGKAPKGKAPAGPDREAIRRKYNINR